MKLFRTIAMGILALAAIGVLLRFRPGSNEEQQALEETRRDLRDQGFKIDLFEFDFFTAAEMQAREAALTSAGSMSLPGRPEEARRRSFRQQLGEYRRQLRYRHHGRHEDERNLLLHYRDRKLELKRAVESRSWAEMRRLPGATNMIQFKSRHTSGALTLLNARQMALSMDVSHARPGPEHRRPCGGRRSASPAHRHGHRA